MDVVHKPVTTDMEPVSTVSSGGPRKLLSTLAILLLAPIIALSLTIFVFQSYQVDGQSMQPTLQNNDRLIVLKAPRTWAKLTGHSYIPARGDIIVFNESGLNQLNQTGTTQLIKRVIGIPGDHVLVKDGIVTVYNTQHPDGFEPDTSLPYGKSTPIPATTGNVDITVPANQIFVCGDNRSDSLDSRIFGTVPASQIVGKLVLRIFPLSHSQKF